jgi:hypothetical protein
LRAKKIPPDPAHLDVAKADEVYQGFIGFKVDWDHRFDDNAPLYVGLALARL